MTIDRFELILDKEPGNNYLAGEELKGTIEITVKERLRIARLSTRVFGNAHTAWRNKITESIYESKEPILDEYKDLTSELSVYCNELLEILGGEHKITFGVKLPLDVISSVDKDAHGHIKYTCMAVLDVPQDGGSEIIAESKFGVLSLLNVDAPHFRRPVESREQVNIIGFCCRRPKGWIRAKVSVAELGLLPGETVRITITVENTVKKVKPKKHSGKHECALLSLCQQLDFKAQNRRNPYTFEKKSLTTAVRSCSTCKGNQTKGPETKFLDFDIPDGLPPTSANETGLVVCSYFFKLDMEHFDVIVPIVIGSQKSIDDPPRNNHNDNNHNNSNGMAGKTAVVNDAADEATTTAKEFTQNNVVDESEKQKNEDNCGC